MISSVVPPMTHAMAGAIRQLSGVRPHDRGPRGEDGDEHPGRGPQPAGGGHCGLLRGGPAEVPQPIIVIDMGTATTLSYLGNNTYEGASSSRGAHRRGGPLRPGAAELPHISIEEPPSVFGRSTIDAMRPASSMATPG